MDLGLVLGNRTVCKVQGSAQVQTLHSLGTPMTECPQQMEDKQEESSLCCFSVGLHPAWSFEGFIQCLENPKQSSSAETALGPGGCHVGVTWAPGHLYALSGNHRNMLGAGQDFPRGWGLQFTAKQYCWSDTLFNSLLGWLHVRVSVCVCVHVSQQNKPRYYWCLLL